MKKADLVRMVRKIVREEILRELPGLINEALNDVIQQQARTTRRPARQSRQLQESIEPQRERPRRDMSSLREMLGYGDMTPNHQIEEEIPETRQPRQQPRQQHPTMIAGVPVEGGLAEREAQFGAGGAEDGPPTMGHQRPGSNDAIDIVSRAIGKAKSVLEESEKYKNYRPGKR